MRDPVVEIQSVTKRYGDFAAVSDLSLMIPRGSVYGLLGPNGAGKTTTIRMIMSIIYPDEGKVALFGGRGDGKDQSHRIGYLPEERGLYKKMKVIDLLIFLAEIKGVPRAKARAGAQAWLERLGLGDWALKKADDLSKGMQQKVQFIATVLHEPELLILDEPFSGLDPVNTQVMKDTVVDLARRGTTILFSTHIMEQAERLCDAVCIIARGIKVVDGPLAEIKRLQQYVHVTPVDLLRGELDVANEYDFTNLTEIAAGRFREDLLYRLNVVPIVVPPLRERAADIPELVNHFASTIAAASGVPAREFEPGAVVRLQRRAWPGNVRELRNAVERLMILAAGKSVTAADVDRILTGGGDAGAVATGSNATDPFSAPTFEAFKLEAERVFLEAKLRQHDWNVSETARALDMPRSNLYKKIERYGLTREST